MPTHYYLPKLEGEININPPKSGCWEKQDLGIFNAISNAIEVLEKVEDLHVSSVPDIWARPLIFQSALKKNSQNPLRERFKQEWRGLLSLLALARYKYSDVEVIPVELDDGRFCNALRKLQPNNEGILLEKDTRYLWTDTLIIKYEKIPVGAFSPTTLVYTAVAYNERLKNSKLDLKDEKGYLRPPVKGEEDYEFIGEWLETLLHKLDPENDNGLLYTSESNTYHKDEANFLLELLKEWRDEMRGELEVAEIDAREVKVSDTPLISDEIINKYSIYRAILCPIIADEETDINKERSDFLLGYKRNYSPYNEVVIITESLLKTNKRIWEPKGKGPIKLTNFGGSDAKTVIEKYFKPDDNGKGGLINGHKLDDEKAVWIRPERYFLTDTLLKGKNGDILTDSEAKYNADKTRYILPLKKEILDFFSYEDIKNDLKPQYKEDGDNVIFSFSLPLKDGGSERIERLYKKKGIAENIGVGTIIEIETPVLEIFPNYLDQHWRRYYLFHAGDGNISVNPVVFGRDTNSPRPSTESRDHEDRDLKLKIKITEISGDNAFPEGLEIKSGEGKESGLIIVHHQHEESSLQYKWTIGVDIGTSNTNIFKQSSTSETAEKWQFNFPKYIRRVCISNDNIRNRLVHNYFVPLNAIDLPIPTTLKIVNLARKNNMMLDYFAFFPSAYQLPHNVYSDIKWDVEGERKTEYFIESLLFLILIEAVSERIEEIEFLCSYPKAFSPTNIATLKGEWKRVFENILGEYDSNSKQIKEKKPRILNKYRNKVDVNMIKINENTQMVPYFETEGIAAGEFFGSEKTISDIRERAKKEIAAICLDIGGGTTDISIWHEGNIKFDTSFTLAGRQIAQLFQKNGRLADYLFSKEAAIALDEKKSEPAFFAARLNLILRKEEKTIHDMLLKHANQPDIQWLRQIIALEFCAISFYSAMLTAAANKIIGDNVLLDRVANAEIGLHWGGNAAKLINWIDFGNYDRNGIGSKMLSAAYYNCLKDIGVKPNALSHFQSPWHKSEAAGGLVVMNINPNNRANNNSKTGESTEYEMSDEGQNVSNGIVCGEVIELSDGRKITYTDVITGEDLFVKNEYKTRFKSTSLERLSRFIEILNYFGGRFGLFTEGTKINLSDVHKRTIKDKVLSDFIKAQSLKPEQRQIEPIFIMEIKVLLEILKNELR